MMSKTSAKLSRHGRQKGFFMKFTLIIDKGREEELVMYAHAHTPLADKIAATLTEGERTLIGYLGKDAVTLSEEDVCCFSVEGGRVYAICEREKLRVNMRLYELEEQFGDSFVKINQSCIANVKKIARFRASIGGSLLVVFKNGHTDYVSRRQLRAVKERIGF